MDCKNNEKRIWEALDKGKLPEKLLSHIKECKKCADFYGDITRLQRQLTEIERLEPSAGFDERIIGKLAGKPAYLRIFALINSFAVFASFFIVYSIVKTNFARIVIVFSKILKSCAVLHEVFSYGFYALAALSCMGAAFLIIAYGALDIFLLSKLIKNGGEL